MGRDLRYFKSAVSGEIFSLPSGKCPNDAIPVVVISPEDRDQVERLSVSFTKTAGWTEVCQVQRTEALQAALQQFADPKPDEPLGRYAVVLDADGTEWVRDRNGTWYWQQGPAYRMRAWDKIAAVKVLSEGVTP